MTAELTTEYQQETLSLTRSTRDNGKENGNYRDYRVYIGYIVGFILGLYWDNGKENGNYGYI